MKHLEVKTPIHAALKKLAIDAGVTLIEYVDKVLSSHVKRKSK